MRRLLVFLLSLAPLGAVGCGGTDDRPARWSYIYPAIVEPNCTTASCHSATAHQAGLSFDTRANAYRWLLGGTAKDNQYYHFVAPGDPQRSKLIYLLRADEARRMPRDAPLPDADIALIETWILAGAEND